MSFWDQTEKEDAHTSLAWASSPRHHQGEPQTYTAEHGGYLFYRISECMCRAKHDGWYGV
jgi:hypothetical protein